MSVAHKFQTLLEKDSLELWDKEKPPGNLASQENSNLHQIEASEGHEE